MYDPPEPLVNLITFLQTVPVPLLWFVPLLLWAVVAVEPLWAWRLVSRPFVFLFGRKMSSKPSTASTKRKSSIYRRGVSVPTTAKVAREDDDAVN